MICSFWLVSALAIVGEMQRARDLMERLLQGRVAARAVRRGVRRRHRPAPRQLPAGVLAPRADRGRRRGSSSPSDWRRSADERLVRRDHHRQRRRRRHARAPPGAVGQADPAARARRLAAARAAELAGRRTCSSRTATSRRTPGTTRDGKPFQPQVHYYVGGATKLYGAALYRLREEDFGELRHHGGISPGVADLLRGDGAVLHAGRAALPGARRARRGPDRAAGQRAVPVPGGLARAAHPAALRRLAAAGLHPFHAPCGVMLDEANMPYSACIRCDELRRLPLPGPRQVRRRGDRRAAGARAPERHAAHQRRGGPRWRPTRPARTVTERRGRARRRRARPSRPTSWSSRAAPPTRAKLLLASASDKHPTAWPTARTRSGATTCSTTARPCWRSPRSRTRPSSRRARRQRLLLPAATTSSTRWATSRWSASRGADVPRREAR